MSPLRRQLLGQGEENGVPSASRPGRGRGQDIPLRAELKRRGLLDGGRHLAERTVQCRRYAPPARLVRSAFLSASATGPV